MMNFRSFRYAFCAVLVLLLWGHPARAQSCATDINGDGVVDGKDLAMLLSSWGACPVVISSVAPLQGSVLGGTEITINGSGLSTVTAVTVGGAPCTNITVVSPRQIRATTPAGQVGTAEIVVTAGAGSESAPSEFTYMQQTITSIFPSSGHFGGGTRIVITGTYLDGTTGVNIGGVPATDLEVISDTVVRVTTPPGSVGSADVTVSGSKGVAVFSGAFTYAATTTPKWATLLEPLPDASMVTDPAIRASIVATGYAWRVLDNETQIELLLVPAGTFSMGCSSSLDHSCSGVEGPVHQITITTPFYIGRYEVTQAQYLARTGVNWSRFQGAEYPEWASHPVENVSWEEARNFAVAASMRLPTEAEWEYAYRAGTTTAFHGWGAHQGGTDDDSQLTQIAWLDTTSGGRTHAVGRKLPNGFGLYDMAGNVLEWTNDWYQSNYYTVSPPIDPQGPDSGEWNYKVCRGGNWNYTSYMCRSSFRGTAPYNSGGYLGMVGFRVVRNP